MSSQTLIIAMLVFLGISVIAAVAYYFLAGGSRSSSGNVRALMNKSKSNDNSYEISEADSKRKRTDNEELELIKKQTTRKKKKTEEEDIEKKLFKAGLYSKEDRASFNKLRLITFIVAPILILLLFYFFARTPLFMFLAGLIGLLVGYTVPISYLESKIRKRADEIMYYLPLVIEQISIGVSSSLDIGPCISHLVAMADDRNSHNAVTEMFVSVERLIRSGLNLEQALLEVAEVFGILELKHTFMFLSQCAKHGGELSKQLQELADSVMTQRQVHIEGKITALPVKATGPLTMIFAGFFSLLFAGIIIKVLDGFSV